MGAFPILLSIGRTPRASRSLIVSCADAGTSDAASAGTAEPPVNIIATDATTMLLAIPLLNNSIPFPALNPAYQCNLEANSS